MRFGKHPIIGVTSKPEIIPKLRVAEISKLSAVVRRQVPTVTGPVFSSTWFVSGLNGV